MLLSIVHLSLNRSAVVFPATPIVRTSSKVENVAWAMGVLCGLG